MGSLMVRVDHGVTLMPLRSSALHRSAKGLLRMLLAFITFPSIARMRYVFEVLLYPRKVPGLRRAPMFPSGS